MAKRIVPDTPEICVASAQMLVPDLQKHIHAMRGRTEPAKQIRLEALIAGLYPILEPVTHSDDSAEIESPVRQARALLEMIEDTLSPAEPPVLKSIARIQALLGVPAEERAWVDEPDSDEPEAPASVRDAVAATYRVTTLLGIMSDALCNAQVHDAELAIDRSLTCLHAAEEDLKAIVSFVRTEEIRAARGERNVRTEASRG